MVVVVVVVLLGSSSHYHRPVDDDDVDSGGDGGSYKSNIVKPPAWRRYMHIAAFRLLLHENPSFCSSLMYISPRKR